MHAAAFLGQASDGAEGPFLWIVIGAVLGLGIGFAYGAVRHVLRRRRS